MDLAQITALSKEAIKAGEALVKLINSRVKEMVKEGDVQIVFYFDEAHSLSDMAVEADSLGRNYYDALCSTLTDLMSLPLFTITLSTNLTQKTSSVGTGSPRKRPASSSLYRVNV